MVTWYAYWQLLFLQTGLITNNICVVPVVLRTRPRPSDYWIPPPRSLCLLGDLRRQVPYFPNTIEAGAPNIGTDSCNHLHLRLQLLFSAHVLAY